jgi:hypothetical protein
MGRWSRDELQRAHDNFVATAARSAATGDWTAWSELFTEDAEYEEHLYGKMSGRTEILAWISKTMAQYPNRHMTSFPHDWCVCDEERGWWICQIQNRFEDPGDGQVYQSPNITILTYAGDMRFSREEDVYNPSNFIPAVKGWMSVWEANNKRESGGPT